MLDAEKFAERLSREAAEFNHDGACWPGDIMEEASVLIRRLAAEIAAKDERIKALLEGVMLNHAIERAFLEEQENARLRERIKRLEEALRPFASRAKDYEGYQEYDVLDWIRLESIRKAAAAMEPRDE